MDPRRKRLLYRCQHCGMKENDILLGRFAGAHIGDLSEQQMDQLEALLLQGFNKFRGFDWMKEPCRTCPERFKDFGGCRCQAYMLTGDAANADPVCDLSPHHQVVLDAIAAAEGSVKHPGVEVKPLVFRNPQNSKLRIAEKQSGAA